MTETRFHPDARAELLDAATYYEEQADGLGGQFIDEAHRVVGLLAESPDLGSPVLGHGGLRRWRLRRFPYYVVYRVPVLRGIPGGGGRRPARPRRRARAAAPPVLVGAVVGGVPQNPPLQAAHGASVLALPERRRVHSFGSPLCPQPWAAERPTVTPPLPNLQRVSRYKPETARHDMAEVTISEDALRQMLRQAIADALDDRRDLLHEVLAEVLEDIGLAEAIREGRETERVERATVFAVLDELS